MFLLSSAARKTYTLPFTSRLSTVPSTLAYTRPLRSNHQLPRISNRQHGYCLLLACLRRSYRKKVHLDVSRRTLRGFELCGCNRTCKEVDKVWLATFTEQPKKAPLTGDFRFHEKRRTLSATYLGSNGAALLAITSYQTTKYASTRPLLARLGMIL